MRLLAPEKSVLFCFLLLCTLLPATARAEKGKALRPNVVLFFADDLDGYELGAAGKMSPQWALGPKKFKSKMKQEAYDQQPKEVLTPHIDAIAKQGAVLQRFYITSATCTASRYTLLTGRLATRSPALLGKFPPGGEICLGWNSSIHRDETSLPKSLQAVGYRTAVIGKWHNFPHSLKFDKGAILGHNPAPEDWEKPDLAKRMQANQKLACEELRNGYGWDVAERINIGNTVMNLAWMTEGALQFLDACAKGKKEDGKSQPFFLYLPYPAPHGAYRFANCDLRTLNPLATSAGLLTTPPKGMPSQGDVLRRVRAAGVLEENAMATHLDDSVGAILQRIDALGWKEETLVLFISDHGSRGKNSCYESGVCIPAFAYWPGHIAPKTLVKSLTSNQDIAATLLDAAGAKIPKDIRQDSHSFLSQLLGKGVPADWRKALLLEIGHTRGVVTDRWKYLANRAPPQLANVMQKEAIQFAKTGEPRTTCWNGAGANSFGAEEEFPAYYQPDQLYDLQNDLAEQKDLTADVQHRATLKQMQRTLRQLLAPLPHSFAEFPGGAKEK